MEVMRDVGMDDQGGVFWGGVIKGLGEMIPGALLHIS